MVISSPLYRNPPRSTTVYYNHVSIFYRRFLATVPNFFGNMQNQREHLLPHDTQQPNILKFAPKNVDVTAYFRTFFRIEDFYAFWNGLQGFYTSRSRFWAFKGIERKLRNYWNTFRTIDSSADRLVDLGLRNAYYGTIFGTKLSSSLQISEHISGY